MDRDKNRIEEFVAKGNSYIKDDEEGDENS
jgi:hypothetical protein